VVRTNCMNCTAPVSRISAFALDFVGFFPSLLLLEATFHQYIIRDAIGLLALCIFCVRRYDRECAVAAFKLLESAAPTQEHAKIQLGAVHPVPSTKPALSAC
jgi:hypothetical protein